MDNIYGTILVMSNRQEIKEKAIKLREKGKTYSEIQKFFKKAIPKSTLSNWCSDVSLSEKYQNRIRKIICKNARKGRVVALAVNRAKRERYLKSVARRNEHLADALKDKDTAKVALAMLYLGEGSKTERSLVTFANSDPLIVNLFLYLLRYCCDIDERKFRCTLQCRADQNIVKLENFWSKITKINPKQFYKARIDPRTVGKQSKKPDYKGVCRIDYLSANLLVEFMETIKIICKGL